MKGNYYLFEPMVDEKGKQEKRRAYGGEHYEDCGMVSHSITGTAGLNFPILTMKKFDHDPFEKLKDTVEMINEIAKRESTEPGYDFLTDVMKPCSLQMWIAISETVKELEGK